MASALEAARPTARAGRSASGARHATSASLFGREVLLPFVLSRALLLAGSLAALALLPLHPGDGPWAGGPATPWIAALSRWDGRWYLSVAQHGYGYQPGQASNVAFSPLYPWLMQGLGVALGRSDAQTLLAGGTGTSNVLLLVALGYAWPLR